MLATSILALAAPSPIGSHFLPMSSMSILPAKSCRREALQPNRPASLMVQQESHSIRKAPRKPVVIYVVSPKIINVKASEFMSLVQRLTGNDSSGSSPPPMATATEGELLGDRKTHVRGSPAKPEAMRAKWNHFPMMDGVDAPTRQGAADQVSCWRSFFANDLSLTPDAGGPKDTTDLAAPDKWLFHGEYLVGQTATSAPLSSSRGQFIDVFCRVLPDSRD